MCRQGRRKGFLKLPCKQEDAREDAIEAAERADRAAAKDAEAREAARATEAAEAARERQERELRALKLSMLKNMWRQQDYMATSGRLVCDFRQSFFFSR